MINSYTEDLAEFGTRGIKMLNELLGVWMSQGLPDDFYYGGAKPAMNKRSGNVFLTNDDYQVAMLNGDKLESFYTLPYGGQEGFLSDLIRENNPIDLHRRDINYILDLVNGAGCELPQAWLTLYIARRR